MPKRNLLPALSFAVLVLLAFTACRSFFVNSKLTSITVDPQSPAVVKGSTQQFTAVGNNDDGSTTSNLPNLTWASSNTQIAKIDSSGLVKTLTAGSSTITATSGTATGTTTLTVTNSAPTSLTVSPSTATIANVGETTQLRATENFGDGNTQDVTNSATWSSDNTNIATVSSSGLVTGQSIGTANITASVSSGTTKLTGSASVTVD